MLPSRFVIAVLAACAMGAQAAEPMSFFVTSAGLGQGGNLGGLGGADRHCQTLADKAGALPSVWRAYLSIQSRENAVSVGARDRIGSGPWFNAKGVLIAKNIDDLHSNANAVNRATALNELGQATPGRWHDILTGTRPDGAAPSPLDPDMTCSNWTNGGLLEQATPSAPEPAATAGALVGHHDRASAIDQAWAKSWNSAHISRGCSAARLGELGSGGLFYCFALRP